MVIRTGYESKLVAALKAFTLSYGDDDTKLAKWQQLCDDCGVEPGPSIKKCKKALGGVSINIWDLIAARESGDLPPPQYPSKTAMRNDLRDNKSRRFPLRQIKQGGDDNKLLRGLLVKLR